MSKQKMARRARRVHTPEFKAEAVKLVKEGGRKVAELSRDLGLADSLVRSWVRQADVDSGEGSAGVLTTAEKEELSHLRREVKVLRMEREILKRAATFPIAPNMLERDFTALGPDQAWVTDITFLWTKQGWLYLAVILDLFSRRDRKS